MGSSGGGYITAGGAAATYALSNGNGFMALGDSISTSGVNGAGGAGYGAAWSAMCCVLSGQRLNYLGNAGVSGQNSTQILARVPDVIALKPQIVSVLAGTNDLTQAVSFATWSANIASIATQLRNAGIRVLLCTIPPRGNTTYLATQLVWNRWLKEYAQQHRFDLLDFFGLLVDPTTGMYKAGYDSGDNLHPSQSAHVAIANYVIGQVNTPSFSPIAARLVTDANNLVPNPLLTAGGPTPNSWGTSGSASADFAEGLVADADFDGQAWQVAYTNLAAAGNFRDFGLLAQIGAGWAVGDTLLFTCKAKITASSIATPSITKGLRFRIGFYNGSTYTYVTPVGADATAHGIGLFWFTAVVPAGTIGVMLDTVVGPGEVGANFTSRVGNFGIYNLTQLGLLTV